MWVKENEKPLEVKWKANDEKETNNKPLFLFKNEPRKDVEKRDTCLKRLSSFYIFMFYSYSVYTLYVLRLCFIATLFYGIMFHALCFIATQVYLLYMLYSYSVL